MKALGIAAVALLVSSSCQAAGEWTLYSDSVTGPEMRIHIATFNASEGDEYNRENCRIAAQLFR